MPRGGSGYDPAPVCAFCIDNLTSESFHFGLGVLSYHLFRSHRWFQELPKVSLPRQAQEVC